MQKALYTFEDLLKLLQDDGVMHQPELSTRTCLIVSLYGVSTVMSCRVDEHEIVAQHIINGEPEKAVQHMMEHMTHIEDSLVLHDETDHVDLEGVFAEMGEVGR